MVEVSLSIGTEVIEFSLFIHNSFDLLGNSFI